MSVLERRTRVLEFVERWKGRGNEKQETQRFWIDLLQNVLDVERPTEAALFEYRTVGGGFIDVLCPEARLLVEQKSAGIDMDKPEARQGTPVTPVQQALRYADALPLSKKPAVLCTCNFETFRFYDLEQDPRATGTPVDEFALEDLGEHLGTLESIFSSEHSRVMVEQKLSEHAGMLVANLHNTLAAQYDDPDDPESHHSLAVLTVRLVFCLYAEDAGLYPGNSFSQYVESYDAAHLRRAIIDLFNVLNTPFDQRDKYLEDDLKRFPYVNGGLFAEGIEIPQFTDLIRESLLAAGNGFDWRTISPVIFGSLMEETLSHDQRRKGGMHYTSVRNIHKVIDPLFLDNLTAELDRVEHDQTLGERARENRLKAFQDRLASLNFLDPACGSGNFLTETYLRLRELENRVISDLLHGQGYMELGGENSLVKVRIDQMHGIEINDFAVSVARTALWIAEQQALDDTEAIAGQALPHLPLHDSGNIVQANALRYDWNELLPAAECSYVMGNPPFIGHISKTAEQTEDLKHVFGKAYDGYLDYVTGWFKKSGDYLQNSNEAEFAFVSTNSITQGQPVRQLFELLFKQGWHIGFAHRTFKWDSQSTDNANVHVVVIGLSKKETRPVLFSYQDIVEEPTITYPAHINGYLLDAPDVYVAKRSQKLGPISPELSRVNFGNLSLDDGHLMLNSRKEYDEAMADPIASRYVRRYVNGRELINGLDRWCLWFPEAEPADLRASVFIRKRVEQVRQFRLSSKRGATVEAASTSWLFGEIHQPRAQYFAMPVVFSSRRDYASASLLPAEVIAGQKLHTCIDESGINFAIAESSMFITWQKAIGGRLKSDCQFSNTVVWNNLPLPALDNAMRQKVIDAGKAVLDARKAHPGQSLADLYDPDFMPQDLRKAHESLDKVVDVAFGAAKPCKSNDERLQILFDRYAEMTQEQ